MPTEQHSGSRSRRWPSRLACRFLTSRTSNGAAATPTLDALRALAAALQQPVAVFLGEEETEEDFDPAELVLAEAPASLRAFSRSDRFGSVVERLAAEQNVTTEVMTRHLMVGMASAPRRSTGEPTEEDWRRLLDAYSLILTDE